MFFLSNLKTINKAPTLAEKYFQVLGLTKGASIGQVKKAYRKRAKLLHPDINKASNAHDQFIELNEAFEYLEKYLTNKVFDDERKTFRKTRSKAKPKQASWSRREKERARSRARTYSKMEYEQFTKTEFYRTSLILDSVMDVLNLIFTLLIFGVVPIIGYYMEVENWISTWLIALFITLPQTVPFLHKVYKEV